MDIKKILSYLVWVLIIISLLAFWVSLRSQEFAIQYGIIALVLWLAALGANYWRKKKD